MAKMTSAIQKLNKETKNFIEDANLLFAVPTIQKLPKLVVSELPFDVQLLNLSSLYRQSRKLYLKLGGVFSPKVCSTMRGLSTHDLFKNEIEYTPAHSEMVWLHENIQNMPDSADQLKSIKHFHDISIFHEQNHRIIWKLLPPAPIDKDNLRRYLNFAESLVVSLDLALADQVDPKLSQVFERMNLFYRPAGPVSLKKLTKTEYRQYLLSAFCATYYCLEQVHHDDILKAVNYVLPENKRYNRQAVARGLELNQDFTEVTNPQWQEIYWQSAGLKLNVIHKGSNKPVLFLPSDPLDLDREFEIVEQVFNQYFT